MLFISDGEITRVAGNAVTKFNEQNGTEIFGEQIGPELASVAMPSRNKSLGFEFANFQNTHVQMLGGGMHTNESPNSLSL